MNQRWSESISIMDTSMVIFWGDDHGRACVHGGGGRKEKDAWAASLPELESGMSRCGLSLSGCGTKGEWRLREAEEHRHRQGERVSESVKE